MRRASGVRRGESTLNSKSNGTEKKNGGHPAMYRSGEGKREFGET